MENTYKKYKSIESLNEKKNTFLKALHGNFILEVNDTEEAREKRIKAEIEAINARINELKTKDKK